MVSHHAGTALVLLSVDQAQLLEHNDVDEEVFGNIGNALGPAIGGAMLIWFYSNLG